MNPKPDYFTFFLQQLQSDSSIECREINLPESCGDRDQAWKITVPAMESKGLRIVLQLHRPFPERKQDEQSLDDSTTHAHNCCHNQNAPGTGSEKREGDNLKTTSSGSSIDQVFINGWQSWTESRLFQKNDSIKGLRWPAGHLLEPYGDYGFKKYTGKKGDLHSWSWTWFPCTPGELIFIGSLDESDGFTLFDWSENTLEISQENGTVGPMEILISRGNEDCIFSTWSRLYKKPSPSIPIADPAIGWTSWYRHYTNIDEEKINSDLSAFENSGIPIDIFQVDDGWQPAVGDWLTANRKFPGGMGKLARRIKKSGITPGLWLAPFVAEKKSQLFRDHPDWILRDSRERPVKAGYSPLWSGTFFALDLSNQKFREYLKRVFHQIFEDWGFELVKLDFLYAAAICDSAEKNRGQLMSEAMTFLRDCAGKHKILACGVPIASCIGRVDYCRIGADIHLSWEHPVLSFFRNRERLSTIQALRNSIGRRILNGRAFINDPDIFILRNEGHQLSREEQYTLLLTNLLFGDLLFCSDDISAYDRETIQLYRSIFPLLNKKIQHVSDEDGLISVRFKIGANCYLARINLSDTYWQPPEDIEGLRFSAATRTLESGPESMLAPHSSALFLLPGETPDTILGSEGHFFPGAELPDGSNGTWLKGLQVNCKVWIRATEAEAEIEIGGIPTRIRSQAANDLNPS